MFTDKLNKLTILWPRRTLSTAAAAALSLSLCTACGSTAPVPQKQAPVQQPAPSATSPSSQGSSGNPSAAPSDSKSDDDGSSIQPAPGMSAASTLSSAKKGTLPHLPQEIQLGTGSDLLLQLWGQPQDGTSGRLWTYESKQTTLTLDGSDKVVQIESGAAPYQKLHMNNVMKEIGKPAQINDTSKDQAGTAEAVYDIPTTVGPVYHLSFQYHVKTLRVSYLTLWFESLTP
ncbi:DUF4309 domain-containing protein [Paenibacillus sp. JX-17]|uniref:DUF4309 domain-containing protein n=1 Tax=Paenibacillus lacisoli TaxID=3064525 RepID=A0ABT9CBW9_9BACL|nr:DUF4309 domain-containing protein [Paenibacillus sp. JX-17]MDO7906751.1 DUF4309 domain-containing protein [Paenibacillus sp. JX-17]